MTPQWVKDAIFYHIYPLGLCNAPERNDFFKPDEHRLDSLTPWLDHIQSLGANSIYLGPVFQSSSHGYDTTDYYRVDRRLGDNNTLKRFSAAVHHRGMRLVLDGVFNHVGRDFWAFKDLQAYNKASSYVDWFHHLRFEGRSPLGDPFQYEGWHGHYSLVKLNLAHPPVRKHLFDAVKMWIDEIDIDGIRLDAADCIDLDFLRALNDFTKAYRSEFWLMGEVVHGDYQKWVNSETLDAVTNYECYKGLYSSLNDANFHEVAYSLNRQFGAGGVYCGTWLYNFVDNHDVDRIASKLEKAAHLYPLYILLFTMPGIPSIYYGSEWGLQGKKGASSDAPLRPALDLEKMIHYASENSLMSVIRQLAHIRNGSEAIRYGDYDPLHIDSEQFVFMRRFRGEKVLVALNSSNKAAEIQVSLPFTNSRWVDLINLGQQYTKKEGGILLPVSPNWGSVLRSEI